MKIYKSSVESFAVEVTEGRPIEGAHPIVYLQVLQRGKTARMSGGGTLTFVAVDVTLAGWNREGRPVE